MPNQLAGQISPYLLQHVDNPVQWYPWGPEALQRAKAEGKPIFLSIGYSACHWCHVMAHESFENAQIAEMLNEHFVSIKVDREERPDLDQIYMEAVQILTGQGGWPLSVFLTPELEPFFGGTYWPRQARGGMPGFDQVLRAVWDAWEQRREEVVSQAGKLAEVVRGNDVTGASGDVKLGAALLRAAQVALTKTFDAEHGGFSRAPKFPHSIELRVLLRQYCHTKDERLLPVVTTTLDRMAAGGMYDQLGGGFHRYSTDARWLVPHFEKMLYDNAMLAMAYVEAWQATGREEYARVARETLQYVLGDMTDAEGGFYSAEDADSEGEEGRFYVWTPEEVRAVLGGERGETFCRVYDVSEAGNFEGRNILHLARSVRQCAEMLGRDADGLEVELADGRRKLLAAREGRVRPARDDKVLVNWNGLMIEAMARAGAALGEPRYVEAATAAARFIDVTLRDGYGRLLHVWRKGRAQGEALLDDHAALANAMISLYEAGFEEVWIEKAVGLVDEILRRFADPQGAGFFMVPWDSEEPRIARKKDMFDGSTPSGSGMAVTALLRLGKLCGRDDYLRAAAVALEASAGLMEKAPMGAGQLLLALDMYLGPAPEIVILGNGTESARDGVMAELNRRFLPNKVVAYRDPSAGTEGQCEALSGIFAGKEPIPPGPTLFVCEGFACGKPVSGGEEAVAAIAALCE